jgi:histidyl-tRNA synthetase
VVHTDPVIPRYDNLVGMFSGKTQVPCVGISFGIDRIFSILSASQRKERRNEVDVYVMAFGGGKDFDGLLKERAQICSRLWDAGIKVSHIGPTLAAE